MEQVHIQPLDHLPRSMRDKLFVAQTEAGRVASDCIQYHKTCRDNGVSWPNRSDMHRFTKGRFALHSQTVQALAYQVLANVAATRERRRSEPSSRKWLRYPHKTKRFFPLYWPAQAVCYNMEAKRLVLPMGRGHASLVFKMALDFEPGAAKLIWNDGYELHLTRGSAELIAEPPGTQRACVDLGEIHQAAVVSDTGAALVVSGRGLRTIKRLLSKQLGELAHKRGRCTKGSRRHRRLCAVRQRQSRRTRRRIRDVRHKGIRKVIDFCVDQKVGLLYVGDPRGVRQRSSGRHHNQRMGRWEMGKDIAYLKDKSKLAGIACSTGDERGTSSRCPQCGHRHKPSGRVWRCKACGFVGHRDVVGGANMHQNGFGQKVTFPAVVTYRRAGPVRAGRGMNNRVLISPARRSRVDTPQPVTEESLLLLGVSCARDELHRTGATGLPVCCEARC